MKPKDWFLRVMVTLLVVGVWVLILKPVLAPAPSEAAAAEKVIQAQRFEVVDELGRVRASVGLAADGGVRMDLRDKKGKCRADLALLRDGSPSLKLHGNKGQVQAQLEVQYRYSVPSLALADSGGKVRTRLGLGPGDDPSMMLSDETGKRCLELEVGQEGLPRLAMSDDSGHYPVVLSGGRRPSFRLSDYEGRSRLGFGLSNDGRAYLHLWNAQGQQVFQAP